MSEHVLVLGTHNQKKRQELEQLLALGLSLLTLSDVEDAIELKKLERPFPKTRL